MKTKHIIPIVVMALLLLQLSFGAESVAITSPTANQDITIGSIFNLTGTIAEANESTFLNCSLYDRTRNGVYTDTAITIVDETDANSTMFARNESSNFYGMFVVPNEFGKHYQLVRCTTGAYIYNTSEVEVNYKRYAPAEVGEAVIDNVVGVIAALFGFVSLIAIVMFFVWIKKKTRR